MITVRDVMTRRPTTIRATAPVASALAAMMELDVRHLPVVNEDHELVGMLSDRDLRGLPDPTRETRELLGNQFARLDQAVSTVMKADPIGVDPDDDIADAIDRMLEDRVGAIPVTNPEGHLVGIVSYVDVLRVLRDKLG